MKREMEPKNRILVIDDDPVTQKMIGQMLDQSFDVVTASNGEDGFAAALSQQPDLVILDVVLPGVDGYEICRRMRANPTLQHLKVILCSNRISSEERLEGYDAGADDYLTKPFEQTELLAKLNVFLRLKSEQELSLLKSDLLNLVAYEIRTPLTAILPAAEMLKSGMEFDLSKRRELGEVIASNARRLNTLADRGLLLSEFRSPYGHSLDREKIDITELFTLVCAEADEACEEKHVKVKLSTYESIEVYADRRCLKLAFTMLVEAAIRITKPGCTICITLSESDQGAAFSVATPGGLEGVGGATSMFDVFHGNAPDAEGVSTSVGFALAREVMVAHGGHLDLMHHEDSAEVAGLLPGGWNAGATEE